MGECMPSSRPASSYLLYICMYATLFAIEIGRQAKMEGEEVILLARLVVVFGYW